MDKMNKKDYARKCSKLSKQYNIPFEVSLVLGVNEYYYEELLMCINQLNELKNLQVIDRLVRQLRSKETNYNMVALTYSLVFQLYCDLNIKDNETKIKRLCNYIYNTVKWPTSSVILLENQDRRSN